MKKLLLTLMLKGKVLTYSAFFLLLFTTFTSSVIHAQTYGISECNCLDNETYPGSGQFGAEVTVFSATGETWTLVSSDGYYNSNFPNPSVAVAYAVGTPLVEDGVTGRYELPGLHYSDYLWSIVVTDGANLLTITSSHTCAYPDKTIRGDKDVCIGETQDYWINEPLANLVGFPSWTLSSGGIMTGGGGSVTVDWDDVPGTHSLNVTGTTIDGCTIDETETIYIRDNSAISLACNNWVNLSMSSQCEVTLVPDMFLEDMQLTSDAYELSVRHVEVDTIIPDGFITGKYVGIPLEVTVIHQCSGNSCWSTLFIEDKNVPFLECGLPDTLACDMVVSPSLADLPIPNGVTVVVTGAKTYTLYGFDGCGEAYLTYEDEIISENLCQGPFSSVIIRHWIVEDETGNISTCDGIVYIERATLVDVVFPPSWDDVLGPNPSLPACGFFPTLENGHPHPSYTGRPEGTFCLNVEVTYNDLKIDACGEQSFKIRRHWKVYDLCTNELKEHDQLITVMDNAAPVCNAPDEWIQYTAQNDCSATINVKEPTVIFECSEWDYIVTYKFVDAPEAPEYLAIGNKAYGYKINDVPPGQDTVWIIYNFEDACGNISQCFTEVKIVDNEQPVPVCDHHTFVALNDEGVACVGPETFDDGSWDNCGIEHIEVSRMDGNPCGGNCPTGMISFCCEDVGEVVMVQMTVWDYAGNSNSCMVEVEVQDNIPPVFTYCPDDIIINCTDLALSYGQYGFPTAIDACDVTIDEGIYENLSDCGVGTITRTFTATDGQGNTSVCQQIIRVKDLYPFNGNNITFPTNYTILDGCADTETDPDDLPYIYSKPRFVNKPCSQVAATYEDQVFQFVDGACFKILRTWTVIDWCQYIPAPIPVPYSVPGKWKHQQIIKIMNNAAPVITNGCQNVSVFAVPDVDCNLAVELIAEANDDCTPDVDLVWNYEIDLDFDGNINRTGNSNDASGLFPSGTHLVVWTVADDCGNESTCSQIVNVHDDKDPTPYCLGALVSVMPIEGSLQIWASDFDIGSFDNCPGDANVVVSFSPNPNDNFLTFTCDDLTGTVDTFDIEMYVIDDEGNYDFCETKFIIQDNNNVCPDIDGVDTDTTITSGTFTVAGLVHTEDNKMLDNVDVMMASAEVEHHYMSVDGAYAFSDLTMHTNLVIDPSMDTNYMEGISTLDLILIQRHILKLKKLDSPYKIIAADTDNSGKISVSDLIDLRKLILGKYQSLPNNDSWRFVDATYEFDDEQHPFPFSEEINLIDMEANEINTDFIAVKIGDVDNSLSFDEDVNEGSRNGAISSFIYDTNLNEDLVDVEFYANEEIKNILGFQTTIEFDTKSYSYIGYNGAQLSLSNGNVNLDLVERGIITISYNENGIQIDPNETLFNLEFKTNNIDNASLRFTSSKIVSEIYMDNGKEIITNGLNLNAKFLPILSNDFKIFQNIPNPFDQTTTVAFTLPKANQVNFKIFDLTGRVVYHLTDTYAAGMNKIVINAEDIRSSGVLYYQLETADSTLGNKMILIK